MLERVRHAPNSSLIEIRQTAGSGRAVFAKQEIQRGICVLTTSDLQSPTSHVILRSYKREVCASCFSYDRGREWKIRNLKAGVGFCSPPCEDEWSKQHTGLLLEAHEVVEASIRKHIKQTSSGRIDSVVSLGTPGEGGDQNEGVELTEVNLRWKQAEDRASQIREARSNGRATKLVRRATELAIDPDIVMYVVSGVLTAYETETSDKSTEHNIVPTSEVILPGLFALASDADLFLDSPPTLDAYMAAHISLTAILPVALLPFLTISLTRALAERASHNAFSIRPFASPDAETTDDEFLGWGVWPQASFFNHSCLPNVRKERIGRHWRFIIDAPEGVRAGEELCITYLGGEEKEFAVADRRNRLRAEWGFDCMCRRCVEEI